MIHRILQQEANSPQARRNQELLQMSNIPTSSEAICRSDQAIELKDSAVINPKKQLPPLMAKEQVLPTTTGKSEKKKDSAIKELKNCTAQNSCDVFL